MTTDGIATSYAGRSFDTAELELIREVVSSCSGLSRSELAKTVCELLDWRGTGGSLKGLECRRYLEQLESSGFFQLPSKLSRRPLGSRTRIPRTGMGDRGRVLEGFVKDFAPVEVREVRSRRESELFRELLGRYHDQRSAVAYGAQLRYLVWISKPHRQVVGCLRYSSPAWRIAVRDRWIGWDEPARVRNLQKVVNNSRFLLLPWVCIKNLASHVLSLGVRRLREDWPQRYGLEPLLLETLVNPLRFSGTSYLAANWLELGLTTGRGRMDGKHRREDLHPKKVLIYPLHSDAGHRLRESEGG